MYPACLAAKGSVHFTAGITQSPLENTFVAQLDSRSERVPYKDKKQLPKRVEYAVDSAVKVTDIAAFLS